MVAIDIQKISKWYGSFQVLKNCSTKVDKGEVVVVCGPSGSGKSTLIKTVNALEPFQSGTITVEGVSVGEASTNLSMLRARIGMVFQSFELFPHLSIEKNLALAQMIVLKRSEDDAMARGLKLLDRVGMLAHKAKFPGQLSGGQQQRVAIARALCMDPIAMLFDEPTSALDALNSRAALHLLQEINQRLGVTIVIVTHDLSIIRAVCHKIAILDDGALAEWGDAETILQHPASRIGKLLLNATT